MTTPEQFHYLGRDFITQFAQLVERINAYAATYESRGGAAIFTDAKHTGEDLTEQQLAENAILDKLADDTLAIIYLRNDLDTFMDATKRATVARLRSDY